jgi:hypothetical protein
VALSIATAERLFKLSQPCEAGLAADFALGLQHSFTVLDAERQNRTHLSVCWAEALVRILIQVRAGRWSRAIDKVENQSDGTDADCGVACCAFEWSNSVGYANLA